MALKFEIGLDDITSTVLANSFRYSDDLGNRNTADFVLLAEDSSTIPEVGEAIIIKKDSDKIFTGSIEALEILCRSSDNLPLEVEVSCVDHTAILDRYLVSRSFDNMAAGAIVRSIIDDELDGEGFTYTNVLDGITVKRAVFNYDTATKAIDKLAELTGYFWFIDVDKDIHFCPRETNLAPFVLGDTAGNHETLTVIRDRESYVNRLYVRAGTELSASRVDEFSGDNKRTSFSLALPCGKVPAIQVDDVTKTVGIGGLDTGKDWYWNKGSSSIYQDSGGSVLTPSNTLEVTYQGLIPIIVLSDLSDEITERIAVEGGNGLYEGLLDDTSIDDRDLATDLANAHLRQYGYIADRLSFETIEDGLRAGQLIEIEITKLGLSGNYLITEVSGKDVDGKFVRYTIDATNGERVEGWERFFKSLVESGKKFIIRENEVVRNLRVQYDECVCGDSLSVVVA